MSQRFPKELRLRKRREFLVVQASGNKLSGRHVVVLVARGPSAVGRVGITVTKRVGNAVVRNRIKRWVRQYVRTHRSWLPDGYDVVVIARSSAARLRSSEALAADLHRLHGRLVS